MYTCKCNRNLQYSNVLPLVADFKLIVKALDFREFYEYDESYMVKLLTNTQ